jgi:hypothetical protein
MQEGNWILVHSSNKEYLVEMIRQMLAESGIESLIINKMDSNYLFGDIEIYTLPDNVMKAKLLIEKFEH